MKPHSFCRHSLHGRKSNELGRVKKAFTDNFGNPKAFLGRLMLVAMEREHLPMAKCAFPQLEIPQSGKICDTGCGGGYNVRRLLEKSAGAKVYGIDISEESVKKAKKINREKKVPCMKRYTASQIKTLMENAGLGEVSVSENGTLFCVKGSAK